MTERTSREEAEMVSTFRSSLEYADSIYTTADDMLEVSERLARDYIALLDEVERYREALEFYADDDTYGLDMSGDGEPIPGSIVVLNDAGGTARLALNGADDD